MSSDERMLDVIGAVYDAALDESRWSYALTQVADFTGSQAASFWVLDGSEQPRLPTFSYINFDPGFISEYLEHMTPLDPTVRYLLDHPRQPIVHDAMFITDREKRRHAYYDWHARHSDTHYRLIGQVHPAARVQAGVALHRAHRTGCYETDDRERFGRLYGHIERALIIGFRLGTLGTLQACNTELLDRNPAAILLLDAQQNIVYSNRSAEQLNMAADGIRFSKRELTLANSQHRKRLQRLIAQSLLPESLARRESGGAMQIPRPSGRRPYSLLVSPISREYPALSVLRPVVCILITDPEMQTNLPIDRLRQSFGLTGAEARLAARLAEGDNLRAAALHLGVSYGTARTRLAEIFRKTDTHRQAELVRHLLRVLVPS